MHAYVISSFPRSGNTWARFVVATAILGRRPSSGELDQTTLDLHKPLPPIEDWIKAPGLIMKSHFEPTPLGAALKDFLAGPAAPLGVDRLKVVHIVRNPFDVAISVKRFYEAPDAQFDAFLRGFFQPGPLFPKPFVKWGFGSWHSNAANWLKQAAAPSGEACIVRYEDLTADPVAGFARIFEAFSITPKLPIAECVALCAPAALRQAEQAEFASGQPGLFTSFRRDKQAATRFVNEARAGGYRERLTPAQIRYGVERLGELLTALGYDPAGFLTAPELAAAAS